MVPFTPLCITLLLQLLLLPSRLLTLFSLLLTLLIHALQLPLKF
jgi:hypothetical protein